MEGVRILSTDMPEALQGLEPKELWRNFNLLRQIPRGSGNEAEALKFVSGWAEEHGFGWKQDAKGNLCVEVPSSAGYEDSDPVCLQGHIDMVCIKDTDVAHDFANDPIGLARDGEWLKTKGTTLGADNGIGLAAAMAIATDPDVVRPPLEILVTTEEETGLVGAFALDVDGLEMESNTLINLDSEDVGKVFVRSAGAQVLAGSKELQRVSPEEMSGGTYYELSISGMLGGHSGTEIHENRGNAIRVLADFLREFPEEVKLISIDGGKGPTAIPADARAVIFIPDGCCMLPLIASVTELQGELNKSLDHEKQIKVSLIEKTAGEVQRGAIISEIRKRTLAVLSKVPNGVHEMSRVVPGMVETSSNVGTVATSANKVDMTFSTRSDVEAEMESLTCEIERVLKANEFQAKRVFTVPSWAGDPDSRLVGDILKAYEGRNEAGVTGIHAGLEVGVIVDKLRNRLGTNVEAASFGPTIQKPHSPNEAVDVRTVEEFYEWLSRTLLLIAKR
ncbi:MAG: beta-Ala-His dipeptidase [Candidatus Gracilibacteria bacterium]